jgi:hypothetical protein
MILATYKGHNIIVSSMHEKGPSVYLDDKASCIHFKSITEAKQFIDKGLPNNEIDHQVL